MRRRPLLERLVVLSPNVWLRPRPLHLTRSRPSFFSHSTKTIYQYQPYQHGHYTPPPPPIDLGPSRKTRLARSVMWTFLFGSVGVTLGLYYRLNEYLEKGKIQVDTKIDIKNATHTMLRIDNHPAIQRMRQEPGFEEIWPLATSAELTHQIMSSPDGKDVHHLLYTAFRGYRGVYPRAFYSKARSQLIMIVGFGHGLDGDLGPVHNGVLVTVIQEAMRVLAQSYFPEGTTYRLSNLRVWSHLPLFAPALLVISVLPASVVNKRPPEIQAARQHFLEEHPELVAALPEMFEHIVLDNEANTFLCQVTPARDDHFLGPEGPLVVDAVGCFETHGDNSPPLPSSQAVQLDQDDTST